MFALGRLAMTHRRWALLVLALALLAKALMPAGYMPSVAGKTLTLAMCNGTGPVTVTIPVSGHGDAGKTSDSKGSDSPCAFSALGAQALAAADPVVRAAAILFAFAFALLALPAPPLRRERHLRPPLRGPPALA